MWRIFCIPITQPGIALKADAGVYDIATLQAVALHDTVEDTNTTFDEVTAKLWTLIITTLYCII
ncbi:15733_t:CDS:2 [Entrophospora sp. SA101]|nr:15733_t:CDS:2 [Entrophospora sp. SA101]CAJ0884359.1 15818_t:CDS:2 [Entrophospora sp. SA101]